MANTGMCGAHHYKYTRPYTRPLHSRSCREGTHRQSHTQAKPVALMLIPAIASLPATHRRGEQGFLAQKGEAEAQQAGSRSIKPRTTATTMQQPAAATVSIHTYTVRMRGSTSAPSAGASASAHAPAELTTVALSAIEDMAAVEKRSSESPSTPIEASTVSDSTMSSSSDRCSSCSSSDSSADALDDDYGAHALSSSEDEDEDDDDDDEQGMTTTKTTSSRIQPATFWSSRCPRDCRCAPWTTSPSRTRSAGDARAAT